MAANFWGHLLNTLRQEQRVTQRYLAAQTGIDRGTIRRIEKGVASPDLWVMETLLNYLGYELEALEISSLEERMKEKAQQETDPDKRAQIAVSRLLLAGNSLTAFR